MKKCKKCGEIFESDDSLCVYCGGKLVEIAEDSVEEESEFFDADSPRERKIATKAEKIKTLGAILLATAAFFALVLTIFTGQSVKRPRPERRAMSSAL